MSDEPATPETVREEIEQQHRKNLELWSEWARKGLTEASLLRVGAHTATDDTEVRDRLAAYLQRELDYEVTYDQVHLDQDRRFWRLAIRVPPQHWTLQSLHAWTDQMTWAGWDQGSAIFEGITSATLLRPLTALEQLLRKHHRENRQTWTMLQRAGVQPDTLLSLEAHFFADSRASATAIADHLRLQHAYSVSVEQQKRRLLRRGPRWVVTATALPATTNPDELDAWTDSLVQAAHEHGVDFDGWGTTISN